MCIRDRSSIAQNHSQRHTNGSSSLNGCLLYTSVIDNEESEETYYDTVINAVTTVEELLKAVTDDIEGLTLNSTLTSAQANKIIKAKKALNQLVDKNGKIESEYANALTSKEKKAYIKKIISKSYVKECAANRKKDKGIIGLTSLLVRINNTVLISAVFKAIALVRKRCV